MNRFEKIFTAHGVALALSLVLGAVALADWTDHFDGPVFDSRWNKDEPNPALGTVSLDMTNDYAHFESFGNTDMWTLRRSAPMLWTPSPAGDFYIETHVLMSTAQGTSTAGLAVYSGDGGLPNFVLQLNHWSLANRMVELQGLGDNSPAIGVPATAGEVWIRLYLLRDAGAGGVDRYVCQYKLNGSDPWLILATYDLDVANARAALFFKANAAGKSARFSYASLCEAAGPGVGDAIKLDFCEDGDGAGGSLADWNQIPNGGGDLVEGKVVRHGDGSVVAGASIVVNNYQAGKVHDNPNSNNWPTPDPYYIAGVDDIYWHGVATDFSTTFHVDPRFAYDVRIYALIGDNPGSSERFVVTGETTQSVQNTRGDRWGAASLIAGGTVFESTVPDVAGRITVTIEDVTSPAYPLNAIVLETRAIPGGTLFMLE